MAQDREKKKAYDKKYRESNAEKIKEKKKKYREANAEKIKIKRRAHYLANIEKEKAQMKKYREANTEKLKDYFSKYRKANLEKVKNRIRSHYRANRERYYVAISRRRAKKKECSVPLTKTENQKVLSLTRKKQRLNKKGGVEYHIDHIVPMDYGGVHHPCNLRIMVGKENLSKTNKITPEALDLVPVCYRLYLERVGLEKAKWFRDKIAEAIGLDEANRLIGVALEDLME